MSTLAAMTTQLHFIVARMSSLSLVDSLLFIVGSALSSHLLVFKRFEPQNLYALVGLLGVVPTLLSVTLLPHLNPFFAIVTSFATYLSALSLSVVIYRVSPWHPLAKFPGPLLNKISNLQIIYIARKGKQYLYFQELHNKYGDYVRVAPNEISIRDVNAVVPVLGAPGLPKGPSNDANAAPGDNRSLISLRNPQEHAIRRRLWNKGFSTAALKDYEEIIARRGKQLIDALELRQTSVVDMSTWMSYFTFDFMGDMAFGGGFELMRDGYDKEGVWEMLHKNLGPRIHTVHMPWLVPLLRKFSPTGGTTPLRTFAAACAERRMRSGSLSHDLWFYLFEHDNHDGTQKVSFARMTSEANLAIVAGSDTTSTVLSGIWYYLLCNPKYFDRLHAEVDKIFPDGIDPFDAAKLAAMPFLNAVINEVLRMQPAVASGSQRSVVRGTGGKMIGPHFFPEETQAVIHTYSLQRDPRYFSPVPEAFWPDRWLPEEQRSFPPAIFGDLGSKEDQPKVILDTAAFVPFSLGPAMCVGKNLALQEMRMVVALMTQKFDMQLADGYDTEDWHKEAMDHFVMSVGTLPVLLKSRI